MVCNRKDSILWDGNTPLSCKIRLSYFLNRSYFVNDYELSVGWRNSIQIVKVFRYTSVFIRTLVLVSVMLSLYGLFYKSYNLAHWVFYNWKAHYFRKTFVPCLSNQSSSFSLKLPYHISLMSGSILKSLNF